MRVGQGYDAHRLAEPGSAQVIRLGGIDIPFERKIIAHSDGDVILHALCDSLLGAIGLGDIGQHFPDSDPDYQDADSLLLLRDTMVKVTQAGFRTVNIDITLLAEAPRLNDFRIAIRNKIASEVGVDSSLVNIKATTTEGMGFIGRREGLACMAVVLVE